MPNECIPIKMNEHLFFCIRRCDPTGNFNNKLLIIKLLHIHCKCLRNIQKRKKEVEGREGGGKLLT